MNETNKFTVIFEKMSELDENQTQATGSSAISFKEEVDEIKNLMRIITDTTEPDQISYTTT